MYTSAQRYLAHVMARVPSQNCAARRLEWSRERRSFVRVLRIARHAATLRALGVEPAPNSPAQMADPIKGRDICAMAGGGLFCGYAANK